jgi:hypothetical protein
MSAHTIMVEMLLGNQIFRGLDMVIDRFRVLGREINGLMAAGGAISQAERRMVAFGTATVTALGAMGALGAVTALAKAGNDLTKVQRDMFMVGVDATDQQKAYAEAVKLSAQYTNMGISEIMHLFKDARQVFARQGHPFSEILGEMAPFVEMGSYLKASRGGDSEGLHHDLYQAMRSAEFAGNIDPKRARMHVAALTAMQQLYGHTYGIDSFLRDQQAAGVALRMADPEFVFGMFPAMSQIMSGGGVSLMTLWQKLGAGTRLTRTSASAWEDIGLLPKGTMAAHDL